MTDQQRSIQLTPSWKSFFWQYLLSILLIPLIIGFYLLWRVRKKHLGFRYIITDRQITIVEDHISQNIDLVNITRAKAGSLNFGVGDVLISTNGRELSLRGLDNPDQIAEAIEKAAESEKQRLAVRHQTKPTEPKYKPGTMDRLDYLTGLWQQGLVSDEDFEKERRNLEG